MMSSPPTALFQCFLVSNNLTIPERVPAKTTEGSSVEREERERTELLPVGWMDMDGV